MARGDKNESNTYQYAQRYGAGKGWRDRYKSVKYLDNFEKAFGKRCIKHCQERLPCKRCEELNNGNEVSQV
jgi:hypothetical protein